MDLKVKTGIIATLIASINAVAPAFADTLQGFICDSRGNVSFNNPTTKDKHFAIPGVNKVATLIDAQANGPVGIVYDINPPQPTQFVTYYYKQADGSNARAGLSARYCFTKADGSDERSVTIPASTSNRGGNVGDGWSDFITDSRSFPQYVQNGQGVLTRVTFIFRDTKNSGSNITLGRVDLSPGRINVDNLITTPGSCDLKDACTKQVRE